MGAWRETPCTGWRFSGQPRFAGDGAEGNLPSSYRFAVGNALRAPSLPPQDADKGPSRGRPDAPTPRYSRPADAGAPFASGAVRGRSPASSRVLLGYGRDEGRARALP